MMTIIIIRLTYANVWESMGKPYWSPAMMTIEQVIIIFCIMDTPGYCVYYCNIP